MELSTIIFVLQKKTFHGIINHYFCFTKKNISWNYRPLFLCHKKKKSISWIRWSSFLYYKKKHFMDLLMINLVSQKKKRFYCKRFTDHYFYVTEKKHFNNLFMYCTVFNDHNFCVTKNVIIFAQNSSSDHCNYFCFTKNKH